MANKLYDENSIRNIAVAIRGKTGKTDLMNVSEMATEIEGITSERGPLLDSITIRENGTHDVSNYASANVQVPTETEQLNSLAGQTLVTNGKVGYQKYGGSSSFTVTGKSQAAGKLDVGDQISVSANASDFGKATVKNVDSGITFTSENGLLLTGERAVPPTLTNPGTSNDLAEGVQLIGANGELVEGALEVWADAEAKSPALTWNEESGELWTTSNVGVRHIMNEGRKTVHKVAGNRLGNATINDVRKGVKFTSENGLMLEGILGDGSDVLLVVKTGTVTTDATAETLVIDTGLSDVSSIIVECPQQSLSSTYGWSMSWDLLNSSVYGGMMMYRSYSQYMSTFYGTSLSSSSTYLPTKDGGVVTLYQYSATYPVPAATFWWVAYGTA